MVPIHPVRALPGRQRLPQELLDDFKRERVVLAVSALVRQGGLQAVTVAGVTKEAAMARNTFYDLFPNRDTALRFAIASGNARLMKAIDDGIAGVKGWSKRFEAALGSLLEAVEANSQLSELCLVHCRGIEGLTPFDPELVDALAGVVARQDGDPKPGLESRRAELIALGILSLVGERLRRGDEASLLSLTGELTELAACAHRSRDPVPIAPSRDLAR